MIICHKYKYIFLKTTKTAGTSIEISLSRFCEPDDIITPISCKDEAIRKELGVEPQNYTRPRTLKEYTRKDWNDLIFKRQKPEPKAAFWNHISAKRIRAQVKKGIWDSYFKFCFVRNPWDRAISRYYWDIERTGQKESLDESLARNNPHSNFKIYTIDRQLAIDRACKYENLLGELRFVCNKLDIPFDDWLPNAKGSARKDRRHYSEILTPEQAKFIQKKCAREIEWFGYEF